MRFEELKPYFDFVSTSHDQDLYVRKNDGKRLILENPDGSSMVAVVESMALIRDGVADDELDAVAIDLYGTSDSLFFLPEIDLPISVYVKEK